MKNYQWLLIIVVVVGINNVALLHLMGYFEDQAETPISDTAQSVTQASQPLAKTQVVNAAVNNRVQVIESAPISGTTPQADPEVEAAVQQFINSEQFVAIMDDYQAAAGERYQKLSKGLSDLSGSELVSAYNAAESKFEKQQILNQLAQGKIGELDVYELKNLYQDDLPDHWAKSKILGKLIEEKDPEGVQWAKELMLSGNIADHSAHGFIGPLYEKEPDFVKEFINNLDLDNLIVPESVVPSLIREPELATLFLQNNFDKIIASENQELFQISTYGARLKMTTSQQAKLVDLFGSPNRQKRSFALNLANNIDDIDLLRDSYSLLNRSQEKQHFVSVLFSYNENEAQRALAKELAAASDDPMLKRWLKQK